MKYSFLGYEERDIHIKFPNNKNKMFEGNK